jgi:hypothetical protein
MRQVRGRFKVDSFQLPRVVYDSLSTLPSSQVSVLFIFFQEGHVNDATAVLRSSFFPGLGWMVGRRVWEELGPLWPDAYWDDWLREPARQKGREILRPEVRYNRRVEEFQVARGPLQPKGRGIS